jgi:hypothetical protein
MLKMGYNQASFISKESKYFKKISYWGCKYNFEGITVQPYANIG